jgi:amino acid permease
MTTAGFINGAIINFITLAILMYCTHLFIRAMDMFGLRSISELCYMCFGRYSIYMINGLLVFVFFGFLVMFQILFSNLATSVVHKSGLISSKGLVEEKSYLAHILSQRQTYVIALTVCQLPIFLKRSLSELKCQSCVLALAIILMLVVLFIKQYELKDVVHH